MNPNQEPKYSAHDGRIHNRMTGLVIPDDEPVFIFRARDKLAVEALMYYYNEITERTSNLAHSAAVLHRVADFQQFAASHPDRMKYPDT